ncbi:MAG: hypothetical protein Q4F72_10685 [Desulfovibrionaceae bacterium]|nr:hypothetical protein [Desulfovibrionaceae bacterium]
MTGPNRMRCRTGVHTGPCRTTPVLLVSMAILTGCFLLVLFPALF